MSTRYSVQQPIDESAGKENAVVYTGVKVVVGQRVERWPARELERTESYNWTDNIK